MDSGGQNFNKTLQGWFVSASCQLKPFCKTWKWRSESIKSSLTQMSDSQWWPLTGGPCCSYCQLENLPLAFMLGLGFLTQWQFETNMVSSKRSNTPGLNITFPEIQWVNGPIPLWRPAKRVSITWTKVTPPPQCHLEKKEDRLLKKKNRLNKPQTLNWLKMYLKKIVLYPKTLSSF